MGDSSISQIEGRLPSNGQRVRIGISDGNISNIVADSNGRGPDERIPFIAPGLIDNQINGYRGIDFTGSDLTIEKVKKVTKSLWAKGVTTYLPTLITNSSSRITENLSILAKAQEDRETGSSIPGFHLEGPYISTEDGYRGAHEKKWVRPPDQKEFDHFKEASRHQILQLTMAPELDGALEMIKRAAQQNIIVALGHHNGSSEIIHKAVDAGASMVTHLGNGCANQIHRHDNPLWPQLADSRLMASLIVDGKHLTKDEIQTFFKVKGVSNLILTSDITKVAGLPPGEYCWDNKRILLTGDGAIKYPDQDVLAGSALTLDKGIENMVRFTGCSLDESIKMATHNPARLYCFQDRGSIKKGKRADIVIFDYDKSKITIKKTIVEGEVVFEA